MGEFCRVQPGIARPASASCAAPSVTTSAARVVRHAIPVLLGIPLFKPGLGFALRVTAEASRFELAAAAIFAATLFAVGRWTAGIGTYRSDNRALNQIILLDGGSPPFHEAGRVLDATALGLTPALDRPRMLHRIGRLLKDCDRVILACPPDRRGRWAEALKALGIEVHIAMPELEPLGVLGVGRCGGRLTALVGRGPLRKADAAVKRGFDLIFALTLLPVLSIMTLLVALAIKLEDGGPIFFRQVRVGHGNRLFGMLKFRSRRAGASDPHGAISTTRRDLRLTRVGRFLRRTSLDELPQLFNVLSGSMSIVGPRPHALGSTAADAPFWDADRRYWLRHAIKPGLTGLAQVRGLRGATATADDLRNRVQADLEYMAGWTLWRDLRIIAATLKVMAHPNAY